MHFAEHGIFSKHEKEPSDWGLHFDFNLLLNATITWILSKSAMPPTLDEMIDRDPLWDRDVRLVRQLIDFQKDGLPDPTPK